MDGYKKRPLARPFCFCGRLRIVVAVHVVAVVSLEGVAATAAGFGRAEDAAHFVSILAEEDATKGGFVVAGDVGAVCRAHDGVADDIALEVDEFVLEHGRFVQALQPGVIDVAGDFFLADVKGGIDEVAQPHFGLVKAEGVGQ